MRYWSGLFTGVTLSAAAALLYLAIWVIPPLRGMYGELRAPNLPAATDLALDPLWCWGVTAALSLACVLLNAVSRLRHEVRAAALGIVAAATVAALVFTAWAAYAPVFATADVTPP
jgi:glucan phosphoethanolaminetransferase (alkaline phosphatase superfamily)